MGVTALYLDPVGRGAVAPGRTGLKAQEPSSSPVVGEAGRASRAAPA
jgi:hypothetical protein